MIMEKRIRKVAQALYYGSTEQLLFTIMESPIESNCYDIHCSKSIFCSLISRKFTKFQLKIYFFRSLFCINVYLL